MTTDVRAGHFEGRVRSTDEVAAARSRARVVAMVGTYPPTECGLATFTSNLASAITDEGDGWRVIVARALSTREIETHDEVVVHWLSGDHDSLVSSCLAIEAADVVVLQHEYGLYGGRDGEEVLELLRGLRAPLVVVLHTVLSTPTSHQRWIIHELVAAAARVVVQSDHARQRLVEHYGVAADMVQVVAHGATANYSVDVVDTERSPRILTWGLLGPGKGIEHAITAVAQLRGPGPAPTYHVIGATHPKVLVNEGEKYRRELQERSRVLGIGPRVHFDDHYRDWQSLRALVREADVVILPYDSMDQESSGVLVEALASGKPVIATMFPHAIELLSSGAGLLVPQGDVEAMRDALARVLYEPGLAEEMRACARRESAALLWPVIGATYRRLIDSVVALEQTV